MNMQTDISGIPCINCHSPDGWDKLPPVMIFDHNETKFPLDGSHTILNCTPCHMGETIEQKHDFKQANPDCSSCHLDIHKTTLGEDCATCHNSESWIVSRRTFNHETTTFPLTGAHQFATCQDCHTTEPVIQFNHTPTDCYSCHRLNYDNTINPIHTAVNFGTDCNQCHSIGEFSWKTSFDHNLTQFPLLGLHKPLNCEQCHTNQNFALSIDCSSCHLEDFQSTQNPDHNLSGYPLESCTACHSEIGWIPHRFNHDLPQDCSTCHILDYDNAVNPNHVSELGFTTDCERCHTGTSTWSGALFDHSDVSTNCVTCHLSDYENASDPPHSEEMGFSQSCETCHNSTTTWEGATFDHINTTSGCVTCHLTNYENTTNPDHEAIDLDTSCETCHTSTSDWTEVNFAHAFPISPNGHQDEKTETCTSCHTSGFSPPTFSCTLSPCHQGIDNEHLDDGQWESCTIGGTQYTYDPNSSNDPQCITCHPSGNEDDCDGDDGDIMNPLNWRNELKLIRKWNHN